MITANPFFRELLEQVLIDPGRVVPFVGAGLSSYGPRDKRLPLWKDLIERLRQYGSDLGVLDPSTQDTIDTHFAAGRLIAATDTMLGAIGEPSFRDFIRRELSRSRQNIPPSVAKLVAISWSLIVTTNLDTFIEDAIKAHYGKAPRVVTGRQPTELAEVVSGNLKEYGIAVAKLHGSLNDYSSWTFTTAHYRALLANPKYVAALKTLFMKRIFFVGFGLEDQDFTLIQDYLATVFPEGIGEFYALIPSFRRGTPPINNLIRSRGLKPIFYEVQEVDENDPWNGHSAVGECLSSLAEAWVRSRAGLPVTLKYFPELESFFIGRTKEMDILSNELLVQGHSVQIVGFGGEGKTTLVQNWLKGSSFELIQGGYQEVFGFSFYVASPERFINDAYLILCPSGAEFGVWGRLDRLKTELRRRRILFILDGLEVALESTGSVSNPFLRTFLEAVVSSESRAVCTSRIEVDFPSSKIHLSPLNSKESRELLRSFRILDPHPETLQALVRRAEGHALSLRIAAALTQNPSTFGGKEATQGDLRLAYGTDPLTENKLRRIMLYYERDLSRREREFLICFSIFQGPVKYELLEKILTTEHPGLQANSTLVGVDIRTVILPLLRKRLLLSTHGSQLTAHPNVRSHFSAAGARESNSLEPLHRAVGRRLLEELPDSRPTSFEECEPFITACYHSAKGNLWSEFHYAFFDLINRGFRNYLGNVLGAWTEFRDLARLAFPGGNIELRPVLEPAYYSATYARCLKHLGYAAHSDAAYRRCLLICAEERDPESAKYTNNFLTLRAYRGDLAGALRMAPWNVALLGWIKEPWRRMWQIEHGASSIGWVFALAGRMQTALRLLDISSSAWRGYEEERVQVFDLFPIYFAEVILSVDHHAMNRAEELVTSFLDLGRAHAWPETEVRALVASSLLHRAKYKLGNQDSQSFAFAFHSLQQAEELNSRIMAPPLEVELVIERLRLHYDCLEAGLVPHEKSGNIETLHERLDLLVQRLDWRLFESERLALWGRKILRSGDRRASGVLLGQAYTAVRNSGAVLPAASPFQSIRALESELGEPPGFTLEPMSGFSADFSWEDAPTPSRAELGNAVIKDFLTEPGRS